MEDCSNSQQNSHEAYNTDETSIKEEDVDPRVQKFLEVLNAKAIEINYLEKRIEQQRAAFLRTRDDLFPQLEEVKKKLAKYISLASPYYNALDYLNKCQLSLQGTTLLYQQAKSEHDEAKQRVTAVEESFQATGGLEMTQSKQESLNRATTKVNNAEHRKDVMVDEHKKVITICAAAENRCQILKRTLKKSIKKAKPFYDLKEKCNSLLNAYKDGIEKYTRAIKSCKEEYAATLQTLELLSENIHESRSKLNLVQDDEDKHTNPASDINDARNYIDNMTDELHHEFEMLNSETSSLDSCNVSIASGAETSLQKNNDKGEMTAVITNSENLETSS